MSINLYNRDQFDVYPFVAGTQLTPDHGVADPHNIILDMRVVTPCDITGRLGVTALTVAPSNIDLGFKDDAGVSFDLSFDRDKVFRGDGYDVYTVLDSSGVSCTMVVGSDIYLSATPLIFPPDTKYNLRTDKVIPIAHTGVSSLSVGGWSGGRVSGDVVVKPGINTTVSTGTRRVIIGFSRWDGSYICGDDGTSTDPVGLFSINGARADVFNNINLTGGNGVVVTPKPNAHEITIHCNAFDECC